MIRHIGLENLSVKINYAVPTEPQWVDSLVYEKPKLPKK